VAQGIWKPQGQAALVKPAGNRVIDDVTQDGLLLRNEVDVGVLVTGIADVPHASGLKEAQFDWEYIDLPSIARRFAVRGGKGVGVFRLFDDGWRLAEVKLEASEEAVQLSAAEEQQQAADIQAEQERKRQEMLAQQRANAERARRLEQSSTPTKVLRSYEFALPSGFGVNKKLTPHKIVLTDVDITGTSSYGKERRVLLSDIRDVSFSRSATGDAYLNVPARLSGNILLRVDRSVVPESFVDEVQAARSSWWSKYGVTIQDRLRNSHLQA
jgi:hypothetical protein